MSNPNHIRLLQFENLINSEEIIHFSTTRVGGYSSGILNGLNLGYTVGDNPQNVTRNVHILGKALDFKDSKIVFPKQTHSANIGIVHSEKDIFPDTDALITNIPGVCIAVRTADCVPVLLYDPIQKAIAAIHSGWKGTVQKIAKKTIQLMKQEYGSNPADLIAGIGPSIGPEVYEVGQDVIERFQKEFEFDTLFAPKQNSDKALLNLWIANEQILIEAGIPKDHIEIAEMCTYSNSELFYSARRDGQKSGRLATGIMLR